MTDSTHHSVGEDVLIFAMAKMAELRGGETEAHLRRVRAYVRILANKASRLPAFAGQLDASFLSLVERCAPLHDIGKVAIADSILLKPGRLDEEEQRLMQSHTVCGADLLQAVARQQRVELPFLRTAIEITRHHHERWDGRGYPDGLAGEAIPLSARIMAVADVYDAMRSQLIYKPGVTHAFARRLFYDSARPHFDPNLLVAFRQCEMEFDQVFKDMPD